MSADTAAATVMPEPLQQVCIVSPTRHGGRRAGAGRKPGRRHKHDYKACLTTKLGDYCHANAKLVGHNFSTLVEAALLDFWLERGVDVAKVLAGKVKIYKPRAR